MMQGVLRGCGKQVNILVYAMVAFWGVGMTTAAGLAFGLGWGLHGLWTGILLGSGVMFGLTVQAVCGLDWVAEAAATAHGAVEGEGREDPEGEGGDSADPIGEGQRGGWAAGADS